MPEPLDYESRQQPRDHPPEEEDDFKHAWRLTLITAGLFFVPVGTLLIGRYFGDLNFVVFGLVVLILQAFFGLPMLIISLIAVTMALTDWPASRRRVRHWLALAICILISLGYIFLGALFYWH